MPSAAERGPLTDTPKSPIDMPPETDEPAFLPHPLLDRLVDVALALGAQLYVERDRRRVLEALLVERGILEADAIEQHRFAVDAQAQRDQDRIAFVHRLYGALNKL
ncbi:MAG TPA: hypothetical protein P5528_14045 [Steroidobacteraceae bacterium]|nr:hypothetical protein [Steroidobacteraceae bacterium]HRX90559.1 hypothetical protein [Steroidobacteraceae bacterium]